MGDYNPKTSYQFRWSDSKKIQKFIQGQVVLFDIDLDNNIEYNLKNVPEAKQLAETIKYCYNNQIPLTVYDYQSDVVYISTFFEDEANVHIIRTDTSGIVEIYINVNNETIKITRTDERLVSEDNVKTLFGEQSIVGQGNIDLFRHQLILTNTNDVSVSYIIESSNNLPIDSPQDFVTVTKADTDYTGHGLYLDSNNNIQPAFIRYSAGNVVIQLQNGSIAPLKSVKDKVTTI